MSKTKRTSIEVQGTAIAILSRDNNDFISLTDMAKKFGDDVLIYSWMRNRNTIEFIGIWEKIHNPGFKGLEFETFKNQAGLNIHHPDAHPAGRYQLEKAEVMSRKTTTTMKKSAPLAASGDFDSLVTSIVHIHHQTQDFAAKAVNVALTLRNWLIGYRIVEFEQQGKDRAAYGESLINTLSQRLNAHGLPQVAPRELRRYRQLYQIYPQIWQSVTAKSQIVETVTPQLIQRLSFTHLVELTQLPDDTQRRFYEIECIRGNWSVRELRRQIASLYYQRSGLSKDQADSGIRLIQTGNIGVGVFIAKSGKSRYISEDTFNRLKCTEVFPGDCLISRLPDPAGRSCFLPDIGQRMITAVDCTILRFKVNEIVPEIFLAYSQTDSYFREIAALSSGSTRQRVSRENLSNIVLVLPKLPEQQKIAEFLSSLDELMAAQARKVDALKTHKKGLMQQLFPREGETQPSLRFPEFQNAPAWEVKPLGKAAENLDNQRVPITSSDRKAGNIPYYGASGIVDYVEGFIFDEDLLCVSEDGANLVARTYPIAFAISGKTWVNNHAHVLRFEKACTQKFVEVYLNSIKLDDFITGMAQPKLNKAMLDRIPIPHPRVPEQQRIADCLSSLDTLITLETQKFEALKPHKKGLMQQLFPSPEEPMP